MKRRHAMVAMVLVLATAANAWSQEPPAHDMPALERAQQAQAAYERGVSLRRSDPQASLDAFRASAAAWDAVRSKGVRNGALEFNLGNAQLQSGDVGRAIASYLRAERMIPGDPDLQANLAHARSLVTTSFGRPGGTMLVDSVTRVWHLVPHDVRRDVALGAWVALGALAALRLLARRTPTPGVRTAWNWALGSLGAVAVLFGGSVIADAARTRTADEAVLVADAVTLRKGNGEGYDPAFAETLGHGVECRLLEERPGWLRIELPDGRSGWIRSDQAVVP
jgi:uncharacterized protein YgiM (DUF1202 family)